MNTDTAVIFHCFETLAESDNDITEAVYKNYTSSMPSVKQHIGYLDNSMKGRMLDQVYRLLLGEADEHYLRFEVHTHNDYGATVALYKGLLTAIKKAVKDSLGTVWTTKEEKSWNASIKRILVDIEKIIVSAPKEA